MAGWTVVLAALFYLCLLFAVAHYGDTAGRDLLRGRGRSTIYALTLGVYCTSWTFYGSVGFASLSGFDFFAIYLGPIAVFLFGSGLIRRVVRLAKSQNITSVADFVASRYGKSERVAALVCLIAVIGSVPYIALQLKAISASLTTVLEAFEPGSVGHSDPIFGDLAFLVALILAGFATAFGTRQIDATEHQNGLMLAVAAESVVKLVSFLAVGAFVCFGMFDGPWDIFARAAAVPELVPPADRSSGVANVLTMTALSAAVILLLPRQFHVTVVENRDEDDVSRAAWMFPLYLAAINLFVLPLAVAADLVFTPGTVQPDMAVIALPIHAGQDLLALFVFIGGLSAATAMVIVACVALAIMVSNDLAVPLLLRRRGQAPGNMGTIVLVIRRFAIIAIVLMGYVYFRNTSDAALAAIGLKSFAAIAQIAPAFFLGLFWRRANARGAIGGLIVGFAVWAYTLLLPSLAQPETFGIEEMLGAGPFGLAFLKPTALFGIEWSPIANGTFWSLTLNVAAFVTLSLSRASDPLERLQASLFVSPDSPVMGQTFRFWRTAVTVEELQVCVARYLGEERTRHTFLDFASKRGQALDPSREADIHLLRFAEHQLSSAIGASSSRLVLSLLLRRRNVTKKAALRLLDDASAAIQYNRDLLQYALDHARHGVTVFDGDLRLISANREFQELFELPRELAQIGVGLDEIIRFNASRGLYGSGSPDEFLSARLESFVNDPGPVRVRLHGTGKVIEIRSAPLPNGGIVTTYADITAAVEAEEALARANETLERRVRERTEELMRLNDELARAKAEADDANSSKTRFLAAASHDILQPLNAARLYTTSMLERDRTEGDPRLAENVDASLEAVEEILTALLEISRLDAGALKPEISNFRIDDLLSQLRVEFEPLAKEKGLRLVFVPSSLSVRSDRRLLRRLLQNLVSNAIKYTPSGRVLVGVRRRKGKLRIEVRDTGLGIPTSKQRIVFREFQRLDQGARAARGLGLGLSIVERIARVLDHRIELVSAPGRGSSFAIEAPLGPALPAARTVQGGGTVPAAPLSGLRVLCIDNEPAILDGMKTLLSGWGCDVLTAGSLAEAHQALKQERASPDVIIADYHLDDGNGIDAVVALRWKLGAETPAVLVTADRTPAVRDAAGEKGIQVMNKPVKPAALRAYLAQWTTARAAAE